MLLESTSPSEQLAAATICKNLKENLEVSKDNEYYSGFFRGVLQASTQPFPLNQQVDANLLGVHRNSIINAARTYQDRALSEVYTRFTARPKITRQRVSEEYAKYLVNLIAEHLDPSANIDKVRRRLLSPGVHEEQPTHYRAHTYQELYQMCVLANAELERCSLSFFIKQIPWYVIPKRLYDGLCYYHTTARHYIKQLLKFRATWHPTNCECTCAFCSPDGMYQHI